jgi:tryptophanyl-tRNA synthetase
MSLQKPTRKMSKSDPDESSRILITDAAETIRGKIMRALTDSQNRVGEYDATARPGVANLLEIWSHLDGEGRTADVLARAHANWPLGRLKTAVADLVVHELEGVRDRYAEIREEEGYLTDVLETGTRKAKESAEETMALVRDAVGLGM